MADDSAKQPTARPGNSRISYGSACSRVKVLTKDPPITNERIREVYGALSQERESRVRSRSDQTLLARLRTGHFIGLRAYKHRIDDTTDPTCNLCNEESQDLEHWLQRCPATAAKRWQLFGEDSGRLDCLGRHPTEVVALARSTLFLGDST